MKYTILEFQTASNSIIMRFELIIFVSPNFVPNITCCYSLLPVDYLWSWLSLLNWIGAVTLSLLLKLPLRKLEPWFILWSFFLLRLLCISINLPYGHTAWCCHIWLVPLVATWNCWITKKTDMQDCQSFTSYLSWTLSSLSKCSKLKSFLI